MRWFETRFAALWLAWLVAGFVVFFGAVAVMAHERKPSQQGEYQPTGSNASFNADYRVSRTATGSRMEVVETIKVEHQDSYDHILRRVPTTHNGRPLHPKLRSVTDEKGRRYPTSSALADDGYLNWIIEPPAETLTGVKTYVYSYSLENVIQDGLFGQSLSWQVSGDQWTWSFGSTTARITFDDPLAAARIGDPTCRHPQAQRCPVRVADGAVVARSGEVPPHSSIRVTVNFEPGAVPDPGRPGAARADVIGLMTAVVSAAIAVALAVSCARRTSRTVGPTEPATEIPDISAARAAFFLGYPKRAVAAEIRQQEATGLVERSTDAGRVQLRLLREPDPELDELSRWALASVFGGDLRTGAHESDLDSLLRSRALTERTALRYREFRRTSGDGLWMDTDADRRGSGWGLAGAIATLQDTPSRLLPWAICGALLMCGWIVAAIFGWQQMHTAAWLLMSVIMIVSIAVVAGLMYAPVPRRDALPLLRHLLQVRAYLASHPQPVPDQLSGYAVAFGLSDRTA